MNQYLYDAEGRLCAARSDFTEAMTGYLYDGNGTRIAKGTITTFSCDVIHNSFAETHLYAPGPNGEQLEESDGNFNPLHFNFFLNGRVLVTYAGSGDQQSNWHYSLSDWVGTRRVQANVEGTNVEGTVEGSFQILPFGDGLTTTGPPGATENEFTGKERDIETGNDYFPARYYASSAGRFLSPDWSATPEPVPYASMSAPQSLNLFSYVTNNPLSMVDESGHQQGAGEVKISCTSSQSNGPVYDGCMQEGFVLGEWGEFDVLQQQVFRTLYINIPVDPSADGLVNNMFTMATERASFPVTNASLMALFGGSSQIAAPSSEGSLKQWWKNNWDCVSNVGWPVLQNDLNPLSPGIGTASDAAATMSKASLEAAATWSMERGLTVPLRSSIVRAGLSNAEAMGRASGLLTLIGLDWALGDAINAEHEGCEF